jgi:hypothetical protein
MLYRGLAITLISSFILSLLLTYPLLFNISTSIPFNYKFHGVYNITSREFLENFDTDALFSYSVMWSFANNGFNFSKLSVMGQGFSIDGYNQEYGLWWFPFSLIFLFAKIFGNYVLSYNTVVILSFLISAAGEYLLVLKLSKNERISIIAGILYAIAPFRVAQFSVGHMEGIVSSLLPFVFYFIEEAYSKMNGRYTLVAGVVLFLVSFSEWHLTYYLIIFGSLLLFARAVEYLRKDHMTFDSIKRVSIVTIPVLLLICASVLWIFLSKDAVTGGSGERNIYEIRYYTPSINDFFTKINPNNERAVYLGYIAVGLVILGVLYSFSKRSFLVYAIILVVSLIIALGVDFPFRQVSLYQLFYDFLPYFKNLRLPGRVIAVSLVPISFFCSYGIEVIGSYFSLSNKKVKFAITLVLLFALIIDFNLAPIGVVRLDPNNSAYLKIAGSTEESKVMSLPLFNGDAYYNSVYLYYATIHGKNIINGYAPWSPSIYSNLLNKLEPLNWGEIGEEEYGILRNLNVRYLAYHKEMFDTTYAPQKSEIASANLLSSRYLKFLKEDSGIYIFEVLPEPTIKNINYFGNCSFTTPQYAGGWFGLERWDNGVKARWSKKNAVVYLCLVNATNGSGGKFVIINYTIGYVPVSFNISVNDVVFKKEVADEAGWKIISIDLSNRNMSGLLKLKFELNNTFSPKNFGSSDDRDLGIAVSSVIVSNHSP